MTEGSREVMEKRSMEKIKPLSMYNAAMSWQIKVAEALLSSFIRGRTMYVLPPLVNLRQKRENREELVRKLGLAREDIRLQEGSHLFKSSFHYMDLNLIFSSIVDNSKFHKALV